MVARAQVAVYHPARLWRGYNQSLTNSPVMTKSLTAMAACGLGDCIAQISSSKAPTLERRFACLDALRTARLALFGLLWTGPSGHVFYGVLDKIFKSQSLGRLAVIAGKVGVDQLVYSPICMMVFFAWVNVACLTPGKAPEEISQKLVPSVTMGWLLWTPAMIVNMALVPANLRMLYINVVSLVWTNILSRISSDSPPSEKELLLVAQQADELAPIEPMGQGNLLTECVAADVVEELTPHGTTSEDTLMHEWSVPGTEVTFLRP
eukprot:jgi/Ulvmu1/8998/UM005_0089.1